MAKVLEIQIISQGYPGAPGYTNLYFDADGLYTPQSQFQAAQTFANDSVGLFPTTWTCNVQPVGRVLDSTTGALLSFESPVPGTLTVATGGYGASYGAGASGACLAWTTQGINRGRLVRGRTFLVPLSAQCYDPNGTLTAYAIANATATGNNLIVANKGFGIWSRPRLNAGGAFRAATSVLVRDSAAVMRSRRS